ncbi:TRAF3-interacting protein 1-like, partial [Tropilaelaps mercedesae]
SSSKSRDKDKDKDTKDGKEKSKRDDSGKRSKDKDSAKEVGGDAGTRESASAKDRGGESKSSRKKSSGRRKKSPRPEATEGPSAAPQLTNGHAPSSDERREGQMLATKEEHKVNTSQLLINPYSPELQSDDNSIELQHEPRPFDLANVGNEVLEENHEVAPDHVSTPSAAPVAGASSPTMAGGGEGLAEPPAPTETDLAAARALLRSARPGTSRRRPMSSLRRGPAPGADGLGDEPTIRPTTARALANVIIDKATDAAQEDEDDTFVQVNDEDGLSELHDGVPTAPEEAVADEQEGMLVKQLLETKQQLERGGTGSGSRIQSPLVKDSVYSTRDLNVIERIREHIQGVSRGALPMGRLLDLLYDDLDSMLTEFNGWREEYLRCDKELRREMSLAQDALAPLQEELEQLDMEIGRESDALHLLKFEIQQASKKLDKVLDGFVAKA